MPDSVRFRCLAALKASLAGIVLGEPAGDPYPLAFSKVEHGPLGETDHRKRYVCGLVPGRETKRDLFPLEECTLPVAIEFRMLVNQGDDDPGVEAETLLAVVQRRIREDKTLGGLALDVRETANELDLDTYDDRAVVGVVFVDLIYRHATRDPRATA